MKPTKLITGDRKTTVSRKQVARAILGGTNPGIDYEQRANETKGSGKFTGLTIHREPIKELTPEIADKIVKSLEKEIHEEQVSKKQVLKHLKQLKAQMGKAKVKQAAWGDATDGVWNSAIEECMSMITKKIEKVNKQ